MSALGDAFRSGRRDARRAAAQWATRRNRRGNPRGTGGETGRINEWPKCRAPGCWHRVPPGAVHPYCRRAWHYGSEAIPDTHPNVCCPGACPRCLRCYDIGGPMPPGVIPCPGRCDICGVCLDRCNGHDEDDNKKASE